jgi:hypothetical protein
LKIIHHISMPYGPVRTAFQDAGIELQIFDNQLGKIASCDVAEDDPQWQKVQPLLKKYQLVDIPLTKFTDSELCNARHLAMGPSWHHGYPQPEDDFGYKRITYDLTDYCERCGIGAKQTSPFRMKKAPIWGRHSILQINWLFDEFFVKPDVWKDIFEPLGTKCRPVLLHRTGHELDSIVQLDIPHLVPLLMDKEGYGFDRCMSCDRKKYKHVTGFFPSPQATDFSLFKSAQHFGSGASARRAVLLSHALYLKIRDEALKGAEFYL